MEFLFIKAKMIGTNKGLRPLSVAEIVYIWVYNMKIRDGTERVIRDEQCCFRKERESVDQLFALRLVCNKYLERSKYALWLFTDLQNTYDRIDREGLWTSY